MIEKSAESTEKVVVNVDVKRTIRLLHVDDEPGLLKIVKQCLEMDGSFQVDTASSVEEAEGKMEKEEYDVIISDYQMPGKDGIEFLREVRQSGNSVPFVIFTGKGREEIATKAMDLGADQYLNKNGDPERVYTELAHAVQRAAKGKSHPRK
jgi:DNA-binding response OmpR family regulator